MPFTPPNPNGLANDWRAASTPADHGTHEVQCRRCAETVTLFGSQVERAGGDAALALGRSGHRCGAGFGRRPGLAPERFNLRPEYVATLPKALQRVAG